MYTSPTEYKDSHVTKPFKRDSILKYYLLVSAAFLISSSYYFQKLRYRPPDCEKELLLHCTKSLKRNNVNNFVYKCLMNIFILNFVFHNKCSNAELWTPQSIY